MGIGHWALGIDYSPPASPASSSPSSPSSPHSPLPNTVKTISMTGNSLQ
nr:hypothetical protein [Nostoc sp. CreGUA01]